MTKLYQYACLLGKISVSKEYDCTDGAESLSCITSLRIASVLPIEYSLDKKTWEQGLCSSQADTLTAPLQSPVHSPCEPMNSALTHEAEQSSAVKHTSCK